MGLSLTDAIASFSPRLPLAVAFSGGADSTALLLACVQKWPGEVAAIHVHHGLHSAADGFARHCEAFCVAHRVPLRVRHVDARHASGDSPEAAARAARYAALDAALAQPEGGIVYPSIALAQHADDQVETMLLALSRGAGLPGLAAMRAHWRRGAVDYYRPLLSVPAQELRQWLAQRDVAFVQDPTNADEGLTRNRIRARLMPALESGFPQFRDTFARSAQHAAQAQQLLDEVAHDDLARASQAAALLIEPVQALSRPRQANLLRYWLRCGFGVAPSAAQLHELLDQIAHCRTRGHQIRIKVATGVVLRRGPVLTWYNPDAEPASSE